MPWSRALRLEISLQEPHRISDRLRANGCIKPHRVSGSVAHASAEHILVEWLCLTVDEKRRPVWPEQNERAFFRADKFRVEARRDEVGNRPRMVGARVDYIFDRGRGPARVGQITLDLCHR